MAGPTLKQPGALFGAAAEALRRILVEQARRKEQVKHGGDLQRIALAQQLARAIAFKTVGGAAGQRTLLFTLSDGDGGTSDEAMKRVNVT